MNETLIREIIQRIMSNPDLLQQLLTNQPVVNDTVKTEVLVLLNYAPNLTAILDKLALELGQNHRVSVLGTDAVMQAQLTLPAGVSWVSCSEAMGQRNWQRIILPTCSANTLAKIALGLRDTSVCELAGRAITEGIPVELSTDYLGFTPQTPMAYQQLYAGYIGRLRKYGVTIKGQLSDLAVLEPELTPATVVCGDPVIPHMYQSVPLINIPDSDYVKANVICWEGKLLTEQDAANLPEETVIKVAKKAIISPLAKDKLRQRNIEVVREMEV